MTKIREQMEKTITRECYCYVLKSGDYGCIITKTPTHFLIYEKPMDDYPFRQDSYDELPLIMSFDIERRKLCFVRGENLPIKVYSEFAEFLYYHRFVKEKPLIKTDRYGELVVETEHGLSEFVYGNVPVTRRKLFYLSWSGNKFILLKYPNSDKSVSEEWINKNFKAKNGIITYWEGYYCYGYVPGWLKPPKGQDKWKIPNGDEVYLTENKWRDRWYLAKEKFVGNATHRWTWRKDKEFYEDNQYYPVDYEGKVIENCTDYWCDYDRNMVKIKRWICENDMPVPRDFNLDKAEFHFYGKYFNSYDLLNYIENYHNCNCERCRMYDRYREKTGRYLNFRGWTKEYYVAKHFLYRDNIPSDEDLLFDCDCKGCKSLRKTKNTKSYLLRHLFRRTFQDKDYPENVTAYYTVNWLATIKIKPAQVPEYTGRDDIQLKMEDFELKPSMVKFDKDFWSSSWRHYPIEPLDKWYDLPTRIRLAIMHCRLTEVPFDKITEETNKWLNQVFNNFFEPECNCKLCKLLKEAEEFNIDIVNELWLEKIPSESYPTELVQIHFGQERSSYYRNRNPIDKKELIKHLKEYVMVGKYCECEKCTKAREMVENSKYIPNMEKINPKCPACGGSVHNKRLVFDNALVAKKIAEMQMKDMLEVKSAFCCSCYWKQMLEEKRKRYLVDKAKAGDIIYIYEDWDDSRREGTKVPTTIKTNKETGNYEINGIDVYEFISEPIHFEFGSKIEEEIKKNPL